MSYRGIAARLPVGAQGFTGTQNPSQAGPGHLLYTDGAELDAGIIRKDGGASLFNLANPAHGGLLDSFTKVLLHFDARVANGQISFPDSNGQFNRTWTAIGNAQISTADSKFGGGSLLLDGTGDGLSTSDSPDFFLGTGDFTFDFWIKLAGGDGTFQFVYNQGNAAVSRRVLSLVRLSNNKIDIEIWDGATPSNSLFSLVSTSNVVVASGWTHIAIVRASNLFMLFVNGVMEASATNSSSIADSADSVFLGAADSVGSSCINGRLDEFRLSKGVARWTANFTPPTLPYADYSVEPDRKIGLDLATKSLLHFDGADASTTAVESSLFGRTWTAAGNAQLDTGVAPKFGTASGLFDGTGDQFTTPDSSDFTLGTGNFTVDFWFQVNAAGGTELIACGQLDAAGGANANSAWFVERFTTNAIRAGVVSGVAITSIDSTTLFTNAVNTGWHHCAFVRSGNTLHLFIDGVREATTAFASSVNDSNAVLGVGGGGGLASNMWNGWIDEFRFSVGIARWTAAFQPPNNFYVVTGTSSALAVQGWANPEQFTDQAIVAGIHWPGANGVGGNLNVIAVNGGAVLSSTAGGFTTPLKSGLTALGLEPPPHFMFAGGEAVGSIRRLFMFSKENLPQATTVAGTLGPPMSSVTPPGGGDWASSFPTFGVLHVFRVFAGGNSSDPHRLYYTASTNHTDFAGAGSGTLAIYPGEGEKIVGAISFRGALIVWKYPQGIYVVDTTDPTPANWKVDRLTKAIGGLNQQTIVQIENDVSFIDRSGNIHLLSAVNEFGDLNTSNLSEVSDLAPFIRANTNLNLSQKNVGTWYAAKRQLWTGMIQKASIDNDLRVQCTFEGLQQNKDQSGGLPPRFFMSRRDVLSALWLYPDPSIGILKPMIGDLSGFVWYLDQDARNKNGAGYVIQFATASTDLAFVDPTLATKQKNGEFLELAYEPRGDWDLTVDIFWDDIYQQTIFFNMGGSGGTLGSFTLDVDQLGSEGARSQRQRLEGSGRRFKMAAINQGVNEDVSLSEFHMSFSVGDERTLEV